MIRTDYPYLCRSLTLMLGYQTATNAMTDAIDSLADSIKVWEQVVASVVDGEDVRVTKWHRENQHKVEKATELIEDLNRLHDEVTKCRTTLDLHIISFILHAEPIVVSDRPSRFTHVIRPR